ncbi:hypothetical protein [Variovorax rhizosphaerae]|uniref:Uncharacterized protein n=1 Tax=Variovorax rhizosphaerae TaxID=1836200 RepID=A0ABU8WZ01_9BURK
MAVSYQLLEMLCASHAPVIVSEPAMVDVLRSYVSAGLVEATIPPAVNARGTTTQPPAIVTRITRTGHRTVGRLRKRSSWPV